MSGFRPGLLLGLAVFVGSLGALRTHADEPPEAATRTHVSSDGAFRLNVYEGQNGVRLEVENLEPYPISATLSIGEQENLALDQALPRTLILPPSGRATFVRFSPRDPQLSWRYAKVRCTYQIGSIRARPQPFDYELPFPVGASYRVDQAFDGAFSHRGKNALDFALGKGDLVCAARGGKVVKVTGRHKLGGAEARFRGKANRVWILHEDGTFGCYAHFRHAGVRVRLGEVVRAGDPIGEAGQTGFAQGPHLHFEVRYAKAGRTQAATVPITFRTLEGLGQSLVVGRTYKRSRPPKPVRKVLASLEVCGAPSLEAPALARVRRGAKAWARLVLRSPGAGRVRLELRRRGAEEAVWLQVVRLGDQADHHFEPLARDLEPGNYRLRASLGAESLERELRVE